MRSLMYQGIQFFKRCQQVDLFSSIWLEGIPNRNSLTYAEAYGIEDAATVFRGTLRYHGFCQVVEAAVDIGLLSDAHVPYLSPQAVDITWKEALCQLLQCGTKLSAMEGLRKKLRTSKGHPSKGYDDDKIYFILKTFEWLGLFSDNPVSRKGTFIDCFCDLLIEKLKYEDHDRDMIIMHHIFEIQWADKLETRTSTLVHYGAKHEEGDTVMSYLVGLPVAMAAELILEGTVTQKGVVRPVTNDIVEPMLAALKNEGVIFIRKSSFES